MRFQKELDARRIVVPYYREKCLDDITYGLVMRK